MTMHRILPLAAAALALAACSGSESEAPAAPPGDEITAPPAPSTPSPTVPEQAPPVLEPMVYEEYTSLIEPGLGCSFSTADERLLLVSTAPMDESAIAEAVVKRDGKTMVLRAQDAGGYDALVNGATFAGEGALSARVERLPGEGTPGEIETTSWPATLTVMAHGETGTVYPEGKWNCGA